MSFDADLFRKELKKCLGYLTPGDAEILQDWAIANYKDLVAAWQLKGVRGNSLFLLKILFFNGFVCK